MSDSLKSTPLQNQFDLQKSILILYAFTTGLGCFLNIIIIHVLGGLTLGLGIGLGAFVLISANTIRLTRKTKNLQNLGTFQTATHFIMLAFLAVFSGFPHFSYGIITVLLFWLFYGLAMASTIIFTYKNFIFIFIVFCISGIICIFLTNLLDLPILEVFYHEDKVFYIYITNFFMLSLFFFGTTSRYNQLRQSQTLMKELYQELDDKNAILVETQQELIYKEKMAALGNLVAGVGHEINTPLSVITGSVSNAQNLTFSNLRDMMRCFRHAPDPVEQNIVEMIKQSFIYINAQQTLSTQQQRRHRRNLEKELQNYNLQNPNGVARQLIRIGVFDNLEQYRPLFEHPQAPEFLAIVVNLANVTINTKNIALAGRKMQKITFGLKNYTYHGSATEKTAYNLAKHIETITVLYENQLKNIKLLKDLDDSISILAFPDQLDQVWVNLIQNAIHAMDNHGTLELTVRRVDNQAVVECIDSGKGIAADILPNIFKPFFTTKAQGEGSGLGLDICSQIVERHQGKIEVESQAGRTCFRVKIPI